MTKLLTALLTFVLISTGIRAENGHNLWLRAKSTIPVEVKCSKKSPTIDIAINELKNGWQGKAGLVIELKIVKDKLLEDDGFRINGENIQAKTDAGLLYGVFEMIRRQQTGESIGEEIVNPSYNLRLLNHWDNLD